MQITTIIGALSIGLISAVIAWTQLPSVGGEWAIYVRIFATLILGYVGVQAGAIAGMIIGAIHEGVKA